MLTVLANEGYRTLRSSEQAACLKIAAAWSVTLHKLITS